MKLFNSLFIGVMMLSGKLYCEQEVKRPDAFPKMVICSPTASLRIVPKANVLGQEHDEQASKNIFGRAYDLFIQNLATQYRDPLQDSQLLYNEQILCLEELPDDWLKVEALEQYVFNRKEKQWKHMQGYIKKQQAKAVENFEAPNIVVCKQTARVNCFYECSVYLSLGTKLLGSQTLHNNYRVTLVDGKKGYVSAHDVQPLAKYTNDSVELRNNIVASAQEHIGSPYCWGGRSFHNKKDQNNPGSCDCSGLINIAYRSNSIEIPRDVYPMYLKCNKISHGSELQPGDCIFLAYADRPENFSHVLMYTGNNQTIESCFAKGVVVFDANERLGKSIAELNTGDKISAGVGFTADFVIALGSFLNDSKLREELNNYGLGNYIIPSESETN